MVTYDIDDKYCPQGHLWTRVPSSLIFGDCYYCEKCDEIYKPSVNIVSRDFFKENYVSDRFEQLKSFAKTIEARKKVSDADLKKLGYLD